MNFVSTFSCRRLAQRLPKQAVVTLVLIAGLLSSLLLVRLQQHLLSNATRGYKSQTPIESEYVNEPRSHLIDFYGKTISTLKLFGQSDIREASHFSVQRNATLHASGLTVTQAVSPTALYLLDRGNNRILGWKGVGYCGNSQVSCTVNADCVDQENPSDHACVVTGNKPPDIVIGQPDFTSGTCNGDSNLGVKTKPSASTMCFVSFPWGTNIAEQWMRVSIATDAKGNLYVPDVENDRVLRFNNPFGEADAYGAGDAIADLVLGQPDMNSNGKNGGSYFDLQPTPTQTTIAFSGGPKTVNTASRGVFVDPAGNVWVPDTYNNRVLRFPPDQTIPDLVLGQPDFTSRFCDLNNPQKLCFPTQVTQDPTTGDIYVADEMALADFQARIVVFSQPFSNGMIASKIIHPTQDGPFENWDSFNGSGTYTPEITGLTFGPDFRSPTSGVPQLIVSGHADFRLLQLDEAGRITQTLGSRSPRHRGGDVEYAGIYNQCGSMYESARLWWPGGSIGFDEENNIYLADEKFHRVSRYALPYVTRMTQNGIECLPDPNGHLLFTGPNVQTPESLGTMVGAVVHDDQLIVLDQGFQLKAWNGYAQKEHGAQPDVTVPNVMVDRFKMTQAVDDQSRLWLRGEHGSLTVFQLPLNNESTPIAKSLKLYWADTKEEVNLQMVFGATYDPTGNHMYIIDQRGARILRIADHTDLNGMLLVDRVFGQISKGGTQCNQGKTAPTADSLCGATQISFDRRGNMFIVDNNYECHKNNRILAYSRESLVGKRPTPIPHNQLFFRTQPDYILGARNAVSTGVCDNNQVNLPTSPVTVEFDSENRLVLGNDGYYGDQQRELRQLWLYENPFDIQLPYQAGFDFIKSPAASIEIPMGAVADVTFDAHDNMIIQDHTWSRVWMINYFKDPDWIIQHRPWLTPAPTPNTPTPKPSSQKPSQNPRPIGPSPIVSPSSRPRPTIIPF